MKFIFLMTGALAVIAMACTHNVKKEKINYPETKKIVRRNNVRFIENEFYKDKYKDEYMNNVVLEELAFEDFENSSEDEDYIPPSDEENTDNDCK